MIIEVKDVTKIYGTLHGEKVVLDNVNLKLPARKSLGILGRNGAGKSTLMRIIGGAEMPTEGRVIRRGQISWPIGFSGGISPFLTGEENTRFAARIYDQDVDEIVAGSQEFADIGEYFYMPVRTYSAGMRARLAFGISMAIDFDVYLVDEITAVGDRVFQRKCKAAFDARRERASIIMVSHSVQTLTEYCALGAVLENGRLTVYDSVLEAAECYEALGKAA